MNTGDNRDAGPPAAVVAAGERRHRPHSLEQAGGRALGSCPGALHGGSVCVTWTLGTNLLSLLAFDDFSLLDLTFPDGSAGVFSLSTRPTATGIFEPAWENIRCFQESAGAPLSTQSPAPGGAHLPPRAAVSRKPRATHSCPSRPDAGRGRAGWQARGCQEGQEVGPCPKFGHVYDRPQVPPVDAAVSGC